MSSQVGPAVTSTVWPGEIVAQAEHLANFSGDGFGGSEAAGAGHAAGEITFVRIDHIHAARAQRCEILLRRRMLPHIHVHRGRDDHGSFRGEIKRGEKIVGDAVREFSEDVRGGRRNEQQINALRDGDMLDRAFDIGRRGIGRAEHVRDDFLSGERGKRERGDKLLRGARHHHLHVELFLLQTAHQFGGFIRRNSTSDPKCNLHRNSGGQLLAPLSVLVLVFVLGGVHGFGRLVFEETALQFFFGDARGLARLRIINHRPAAHHQLPGAPRRHHHVGELAFRCFA